MTEPAEVTPAEALWRDYAFLTREMAKFIDRQDLDMFFSLMDQRETLQQKIGDQTDKRFAASVDGRSLLEGIRQEEQVITQKLQLLRNQANQQQQISRAYDAFGALPTGRRMDLGS